MRCITIAKEIAAFSEKVAFFVADEESKELLDTFAEGNAGIEPVVLGTNWRDMEGELSALEKELTKRDIHTIMVDSYQVTYKYFERLSKVCRTAYLDDLGREAYPVDLLINYSGYSDELGYGRLYGDVSPRDGRSTEFLLGLMYAPLREQFKAFAGSGESACRGRDELSILLTSGGGDIRGMIMPVLKGADESGLVGPAKSGLCINWHVVLGNMVENAKEIAEFAASHQNINVYRNVTDMAARMRKCDLAVAAAGTVLTECAALKLPVIFYQVADNQSINVRYWQKCGGMVFAGDVTSGNPEEKQAAVSAITNQISEIMQKREMLKAMSTSLNGITDGRGAERIARALLEL
jgi:spore coat polysaccharide biosynthesis predicted glycosyltransferase SpsG